jgi:hypothetical protein
MLIEECVLVPAPANCVRFKYLYMVFFLGICCLYNITITLNRNCIYIQNYNTSDKNCFTILQLSIIIHIYGC